MASTSATAEEEARLAAARAGDGAAFRALVGPHERAVHVHCYRMLGSYHDAEEATQETMLRAWRSLGTFEGRASLSTWLYRIATTTCLKAIRARRPATPVAADAMVEHLQPYPDRLLDGLVADGADPAAVAERRESVELAFVVALQHLPARQRAALILCDVLSWSAAETAGLLDSSVAAVNSALQRARATLRDRLPARPSVDPTALSAREHAVVRRFMAAWHRWDLAELATLLREDAVLEMPPVALRFVGPDAIVAFFRSVPAGSNLDRVTLVPTRANGQPALAAYLPDADGVPRAYGVMVLAVVDGAVAAITGFQEVPTLFPAFGLPATHDGAVGGTRDRAADDAG